MWIIRSKDMRIPQCVKRCMLGSFFIWRDKKMDIYLPYEDLAAAEIGGIDGIR